MNFYTYFFTFLVEQVEIRYNRRAFNAAGY